MLTQEQQTAANMVQMNSFTERVKPSYEGFCSSAQNHDEIELPTEL
jgi:hypothetical protein